MATPKIRLKGFEGEWEPHSLKENVFSIIAGGDIDKNIIKEQGQYPVIANALSNDGIVGYYDNYYRVKAPAVSVTGRGEIGFAKARKKSFTPVVRLLSIVSYHDVDFLANAINCLKVVQESTGVPQLTTDKLSQYEISFPNDIAEERAIGNYHVSLDSLIQTTAKKIESLKQMKAASLISMFPQEGETTPKVRFKGFEGEWKKCQLKEIATFSKGNGYSKADLCSKGNPIVLYGRLYTHYSTIIDNVDTFAIAKENTVFSKGGEVVIPASGETPEDIAIASSIAKAGIILGGDLNILSFDNSKFNSPFIALAISYSKTHFELSRYAQGKSVVHLRNNDISNGHIELPSIQEQLAIASYFQNLDTQISLHTQRLEKLKNIKAECLNKMFV